MIEKAAAWLALCVRGIWSAWLVLGVELAVVLALHHGEVTGVWEVQMGVLGLAPSVLLFGTVLGLLGGAFSAFVLRAAEHRDARIVATSVGVLGSVAFAYSVSDGRHFQDWAMRAGLLGLVAGLFGLGFWFGVPAMARSLSTRPRQVALGGALGLVLLELANQKLWVRLYPGFHTTLALVVPSFAPLVAWAVSAAWGSTERPGRVSLAATGVAVAAGMVLFAPSQRRFSGFDNLRLILAESAPVLGHAVRTAAALFPPDEADSGEVALTPEGTAANDGPSALDFRGRDILLVSIDALRADHVGAYGYERRTTPAIDALARDGVRFSHAYTTTPHTSYAVTSLMTGKYMRPLLLQGAGEDSDTWAGLLRLYGYRTGAFYPPAVFFIDVARFASFEKNGLGFEYRKTEFLEGEGRVKQVGDYLRGLPQGHAAFVWVHLFGPHEPYVAQPGHEFGDRDVDRYDSEIAAADKTLAGLLAAVRKRDPHAIVIVAADHGEEFGDHGGRYHGSSVYEEQVRVPLVISAPGQVVPRVVDEPVQTIDLLPTVLAALQIPRPPRIRGRDLGALIGSARDSSGKPPGDSESSGDSKAGALGRGFALADTDDQAMLASGRLRLICQKRLGACRLFDVDLDPTQQKDVSADYPAELGDLKKRLRELNASHGAFETTGLRAEGKGWPPAILRGLAGEGDAAEEISSLLDDTDPAIQRKAAELLFELSRPETAPALRLALSRVEDEEVKRWCALGLTRMGEGAPLVFELFRSATETRWRRLAALALAEAGDKRGADVLVEWWHDTGSRDYERSRQLLKALSVVRSKDAVWPLLQSLDDVRLRPYIAETLAKIGDDGAVGALLKAFREERYQSARVAIARALVALGAGQEIAVPLARFLGVPDPLTEGLELAQNAGSLEAVGGPNEKDLRKIREHASLGAAFDVFVPKGGNGSGTRVIVRARSKGPAAGTVRVGIEENHIRYDSKGKPVIQRNVPKMSATDFVELQFAPAGPVELAVRLPEQLGARAGRPWHGVVFAESGVEVEAIAVVPLADELPPPPPK